MIAAKENNTGTQSKKRIWIEIAAYLFDKLSKLFNLARYGSWAIDITNIELGLSSLPPEFDDFRIVQIGDFHYGSWLNQDYLMKVIDQVNNLEPDLVVITGDFVSFYPQQYSQELTCCLKALRPKEHTLAVLGNHDHWSDADEVRQILTECQIRELNNQVISLKRGAAHLYIGGIDDVLCGLDDLDAVVSMIPAGSAAILLAHEPDFADISAATGRFQLQLSGHSHGGQILLPFFSRLFLPYQARKYPKGLYRIKDMDLYTNRGIGTTWLNLRYNCPPEITLIKLRTGGL